MEGRVFYKQVGTDKFEEIEFSELKQGDHFIIRDFPEDETAFERGERLFKIVKEPYDNLGIGTVGVEVIGFRKNA